MRRPRLLSLAWLLGANLFPLYGVLYLDWITFHIVLIYWFECVVLAVFDVLHAAVVGPSPARIAAARFETPEGAPSRVGQVVSWVLRARLELAARVLNPLLFLGIFGFICIFYGLGIDYFLAGEHCELRFADPPRWWEDRLPYLAHAGALCVYVLTSDLRWSAIALAVGHLESFVREHLPSGADADAPDPGPAIERGARFVTRIIPLHLALAAAGLVVETAGSPLVLLITLVFGKTALELAVWLAAREPQATAAEDGAGRGPRARLRRRGR